MLTSWCCGVMLVFGQLPSHGVVLQSGLHHLRSGPVREWAEFPELAESGSLDITFEGTANTTEQSLHLRQQDVKQVWQVRLNEELLGELVRDEQDVTTGWALPPGRLRDGENRLRIVAKSAEPALSDDIRVGEIRLDHRPLIEATSEATLAISIRDNSGLPLPSRLTLVNAAGSLPLLGTSSSETLAIRHGVVYLAQGAGEIRLPAGTYTLFAGRGFEYSLARKRVVLTAGEHAEVALTLTREVPTEGYVACDTHLHTVTYSGHGDASLDERLISIAGEGIELAIATDHNRHVEYASAMNRLGLSEWFTPVVGNELTTGRGHFCIFPLDPQQPPANHRLGPWSETFAAMGTAPPIVILNHARDLHSGVRPFGPKLFNAAVGEHAEAWPAGLNAMEVINSGAIQTDPLQLFQDWMALLNRGRHMTPIGCSDSHDVSRFIAGQGRTYIRCEDRDPGRISLETAVASLRQGRVMVSYGLLTEMVVNERYRSGDVVPVGPRPVEVMLRVLAPAWTQATRLVLYANGEPLREFVIPSERDSALPRGVQWSQAVRLPAFGHDVHLVAIATGPGIDGAYWPTAKPYQPTSAEWTSQVLGCSGAIWLDVDGDGVGTSARHYAERLVTQAGHERAVLLRSLEHYDAAVSAQAAFLWHQTDADFLSEGSRMAWRGAVQPIRSGFERYVAAWRAGEIARAE